MKRQSLLTRMLLLFALIAGSSSASWAEDVTWTHEFASPEAISNNSITVNSATWTVSTEVKAGSPTIDKGNSYSKYCLKFGSGKNNCFSSITFSTDYFDDYNVKSVTVQVLHNASKSGTLTATQGSTTIGTTTATIGTSWTNMTVDAESGSGGTLSFTYSPTDCAVNIHSITVVYTSGPTTYSVTYDGNGNTSGAVPTDGNAYESGATVTVLGNTGNLAKAGYTFGGWNTQDDGLGTPYNENDTFEITEATTLYAKWNAKTITGLTYEGTPTKTTYNAGESFDPTGLTVTATFDDSSSEDVTSSVTWTPSPLTQGTTSVTGTYMGQSITINGLTVTAAPGSTAENAYTVAEAIAAIDAAGKTTISNKYVRGIVSQVDSYNSNYNSITYWISDDGTKTSQFEVYGGLSFDDGTSSFSSKSDVQVGDVVVVKGNITYYSNNKIYEFEANNHLVSLKLVAPTFSPAAGAVSSGTELTISDLHTDATIYYSTDGTDPTASSTQYNSNSKPTITAATTFKAIAVKNGYTTSDVATAGYTLLVPVATPTITLAGGTYTSVQTTTITCDTEGATIYYTTDGSAPTTSSTAYSGAISITESMTIKAIAVKSGMANSAVAEATYLIQIPKHTLTVSASHGSVEITGKTLSNSACEVEEGESVTATATADEHYTFTSWTATGVTLADATANPLSFTMPTNDVTLTATFTEDAKYTATFYVQGILVNTDANVYEGEAITFPSVTAPAGYTFMGWTTSAITGEQNNAPETLVTSAIMGNADVTYHAVFAIQSGSSTTATLSETEITTNFTNAAMAYNDDPKSYNDTSDGVTWTVKGYATKDVPWIQLRKNNIVAYLKIAASSNISNIKFTISNSTVQTGESTSDITKHGPFAGDIILLSSPTANATAQTEGILGYTNSVSNNVANVAPTSSVQEVYVQVTAAARIWGVEVTCGNSSYSNYCTTVSKAVITLNAACTDGSMVYGTYSNSSAFVVPEDIVVSEVGIVDGKLWVEEYETGDIVPANTGVMVSALAGGNYYVQTTTDEGASVLGDDNCLRASGDAGITAEAMAAADTNSKYYRLTMHNGTQIGFWWGAAEGAAFAVAANKAYLAVPQGEGNARGFSFADDMTTGVDSVHSSQCTVHSNYNLNGQRVQNPTKGLYIVNGKKVVVK